MLVHYGGPPGRNDPDPTAPAITKELISDFALGLLDAAGKSDHCEVVWSGSPRVVGMIRDAIQKATGATPTEENAVDVKRLIAYQGPLQVMALKGWLPASRVR